MFDYLPGLDFLIESFSIFVYMERKPKIHLDKKNPSSTSGRIEGFIVIFLTG